MDIHLHHPHLTNLSQENPTIISSFSFWVSGLIEVPKFFNVWLYSDLMRSSTSQNNNGCQRPYALNHTGDYIEF